MKKRVWMLTIAAAAVLALGGCSGSEDPRRPRAGRLKLRLRQRRAIPRKLPGGAGRRRERRLRKKQIAQAEL